MKSITWKPKHYVCPICKKGSESKVIKVKDIIFHQEVCLNCGLVFRNKEE